MNADETFEKFHGTWPATDDPDYQAYATERDAYKCGWDAARAGMVPEADYDKMMVVHAERLEEILNLKAELAKAWEAGRGAALDWVFGQPTSKAYTRAEIERELQPPGGKAK